MLGYLPYYWCQDADSAVHAWALIAYTISKHFGYDFNDDNKVFE